MPCWIEFHTFLQGSQLSFLLKIPFIMHLDVWFGQTLEEEVCSADCLLDGEIVDIIKSSWKCYIERKMHQDVPIYVKSCD